MFGLPQSVLSLFKFIHLDVKVPDKFVNLRQNKLIWVLEKEDSRYSLLKVGNCSWYISSSSIIDSLLLKDIHQNVDLLIVFGGAELAQSIQSSIGLRVTQFGCND